MKWTKEEVETHIKKNLQDGENYSYGGAVVCAALFKKLYGVYPKIGLSGFQAGAVDALQEVLPDSLEEKPKRE